MTTYPTLRIGVLQALVELRGQYEHNDKFFEATDCPYDKETVAALKQIFKTRVVEKEVIKEITVPVSSGSDAAMTLTDQEEVAESAKELLTQLKELGEGERGLDTQTKIQIIKTKATLIEQLLKLRERWLNVKRMSQFQTVVISILDDLVEEDDRNEFLKRIEPYRE